MFSQTTKQMLRNVIRHTGTHNRMVEEGDMWKQFQSSKERNDQSARKSFLYDQRSDDYDDKRRRTERSAHMDSDSDEPRREKSTYWTQQLQKFEEADPDRWGHSGYKELYPDDFSRNQHSQRDNLREDRRHDDRMKRTSKKKKKEKKHKKKKKKERKRREISESESDSDNDSQSRRDRHKNHKSRAKYQRDSESDSSGSSDQERHRKTKKGKHRREHSSSDSECSENEPRHRKTKKRKHQNSFEENGESKKRKHKR